MELCDTLTVMLFLPSDLITKTVPYVACGHLATAGSIADDRLTMTRDATMQIIYEVHKTGFN